MAWKFRTENYKPDWTWYRHALYKIKRDGMTVHEEDMRYVQRRVKELAKETWDTSFALGYLIDAYFIAKRCLEELECIPLIDFTPPDWWIPECPRCKGHGFVSEVVSKESSFDFGVGSYEINVPCPMCGLGDLTAEDAAPIVLQ